MCDGLEHQALDNVIAASGGPYTAAAWVHVCALHIMLKAVPDVPPPNAFVLQDSK